MDKGSVDAAAWQGGTLLMAKPATPEGAEQTKLLLWSRTPGTFQGHQPGAALLHPGAPLRAQASRYLAPRRPAPSRAGAHWVALPPRG